MFVDYSIFVRLTWKFTFWSTWPSLNINLSLNTKIFQGILSHLYGNYKQDIEGEWDPNTGESAFFEKILADENLHTSWFNSSIYKFAVWQCYKQSTSIMYEVKKIYRACIIHCIFFIRKPFFTWASIFLI